MTRVATEIAVRWRRPGFDLAVETAFDARVAVLFGPSGGGKTTLLETVLGLHPQAQARIRLAGELLEDPERRVRVPVEARRLGWVPQEASLLPHLSVEGNLRLGNARAGATARGSFDRAVEVLEIGPLLGRPVGALSGGERQRVALARALASGPRALLLDEPLASLDRPLRARVLPYLLRVRDDLGLPMLYITHDPDEAILLGEWVVVLEGGRVVAAGAPREVLFSQAVFALSEALGLENVLEGRARSGRPGECVVEVEGGLSLVVPGEAPPDGLVRLGLRGEDVLLAADPPGRISARNVLPARVVACEERGADVWVRLDAGAPLVAKVTRGAALALGLRPGERVYAVIKAQALRRL